MIPLGDASRRPLTFPIVTVLLIVVNALFFLLELADGETVIAQWALVPARITAGQAYLTILTSMFLHGGWTHILGNMLFLWVFGPQIEDVMGPMRYLLFYLVSGVIATAAQILVDPSSMIPQLGASGAIAGVMGAFLITYPRDRIRTILIFGWFMRVTRVPAIILVGFWFLMQLFNSLGALADVQSSGVAYMAHIGGFIFGALTARLFESRLRLLQRGL